MKREKKNPDYEREVNFRPKEDKVSKMKPKEDKVIPDPIDDRKFQE